MSLFLVEPESSSVGGGTVSVVGAIVPPGAGLSWGGASGAPDSAVTGAAALVAGGAVDDVVGVGAEVVGSWSPVNARAPPTRTTAATAVAARIALRVREPA